MPAQKRGQRGEPEDRRRQREEDSAVVEIGIEAGEAAVEAEAGAVGEEEDAVVAGEGDGDMAGLTYIMYRLTLTVPFWGNGG